MKDAVIIDAVRTPIGRAHAERGFYRHTRSDDLAVACLQALLDRTGISADQVEDIVLGNTQQTMEQGMNVARNVGLMAGLSVATGGTTVNRLCGSSLQALNQASHAIAAGAEDIQIVGGLEHMQHLPMDYGLDINPKLFRSTSKGALMMGVTAEFLAQSQGISRADQDAFAVASHQKATTAQREGKFATERISLYGYDETENLILLDFDQCVRPDTSLEALAALEPAFMPKIGTVTAGNSSPLNDGAAALLIMSADRARELDLRPIAKVRASAVAGVDPCVMGTGPVPATRKALQRAGLSLADIGLIELNEAFAAQALACIRMLQLDVTKVNVHGGAIAIGHPLGASGARIATTLVHAMRRNQIQFGLATMCIGAGQGIATVFELVA
ncbi:MAG: acetyl-CoA C-acyltransferase [Planctomycetota bacterium]|nr:acetyl-CoA C-acyltransferase [Planctomycetota bacterium]MDA1180314.1 acetyl-CoA C-acyltransferase [Planctomycetota bacterium]